MKILEVADLVPNKLGGFERYCITNSHYLKRNGHQHILLFSGDPCRAVKESLAGAGAKVAVRSFRRLGFFDSARLSAFAIKEKVDVVHLHFYEPYNVFTLVSPFLPFQTFVTFHISVERSLAPGWFRFLRRIRTRMLGAGVAGVFCVSQFSRQRFLTNYQANPSKVSVVHNGVSLDAFEDQLPRPFVKGNEPFRVICVASLIEE